MRQVVLYIAMSLDGCIARADGCVDWLDDPNLPQDELLAGYQRFYASVDTLIMGRKTYDQVLTFGSWPYAGKTCFVATHRSAKPDSNVTFTAGSPGAMLEQAPAGVIWLVGGSDLVRQFAEVKLIDEYRITVIPTVLGSGIRLFPEGFPPAELDLTGTEVIGGTVELRYVKRVAGVQG